MAEHEEGEDPSGEVGYGGLQKPHVTGLLLFGRVHVLGLNRRGRTKTAVGGRRSECTEYCMYKSYFYVTVERRVEGQREAEREEVYLLFSGQVSQRLLRRVVLSASSTAPKRVSTFSCKHHHHLHRIFIEPCQPCILITELSPSLFTCLFLLLY